MNKIYDIFWNIVLYFDPKKQTIQQQPNVEQLV